MPLKKHIVLTGFMGTGKTAVGKILSERLSVGLVDTDEEIVKKTGRSIPQIFAGPDGEKGFRNIESEVIKEVARRRPFVVISAGGGAVLRRENVDEFKRNGIIINLRALPETIYFRLAKSSKEISGRPLLASFGGDSTEALKRIKELLALRASSYAECDFFLDTDGKTPNEVADEIIKKIETVAE